MAREREREKREKPQRVVRKKEISIYRISYVTREREELKKERDIYIFVEEAMSRYVRERGWWMCGNYVCNFIWRTEYTEGRGISLGVVFGRKKKRLVVVERQSKH